MKTPRFLPTSLISGLSCLLLIGCAAAPPPPQPSFAPTTYNTLPETPVQQAEGSLFDPQYETSLFADFRGRRVGDVVTILIEEDLKGSKSVKTQTNRKSNMNVGLTGLLGLDWEKRLQPRYDSEVDATNAIGGSTTDKFDGSGKTSRDASLTGTISARVIQVLPDRNLLVRGTRELRINNETQYLILTGVVRPKDISPENTISSTRIADAQLEYTGGGVLSEKQSPAWFARIMGLMALF